MLVHFDEARDAAEQITGEWLDAKTEVVRALLVADIFGKLRLLLWSEVDIDLGDIDRALLERCDAWWTGEVVFVKDADENTKNIYAQLWDQASHDGANERLAVLNRHRHRSGWFEESPNPLWEAPKAGPPVIVFYSFKGGFGRSTTLASFAIQRARGGDRVCVIDFDLDSPGIGLLLNHDSAGGIARWGVVDFLIEQSVVTLPLSDYYHRCDRVAGVGEILVIPAGVVDESYAHKLARVDLEESPSGALSGISTLLRRVRDELQPTWILLDSRTGISEAAGQLLSGVAHLHVLLGTLQDQSWRGLNIVLDHLGKERVLRERGQAEIVLVQAMVPPGEAGKLLRSQFLARSESEFAARYYVDGGADGSDIYWDIGDVDSGDAPHVPIALDYDARLATFGDISEVADVLCAEPYVSFGERVVGRFVPEALDEY
jgi:cellulose biosynthesis protein BcsQ